MKPWLKRKKHRTLLADLPLEEEYNYNILLRMTPEIFEEIFQLIKDDIPKEKKLERINPVQTITCSHNWLFINRVIIQKLWL